MKKRMGFVSNSSSSSYVVAGVGNKLTQSTYRDLAWNAEESVVRIEAINKITSIEFLKKLKNDETDIYMIKCLEARINEMPNSVKFIGEDE